MVVLGGKNCRTAFIRWRLNTRRHRASVHNSNDRVERSRSMKVNKPLSEIAADLDLPWRVEWDSADKFASFSPSDDHPHWRIVGRGGIIQARGMRRADAQFVAEAVNAAAGGYGRPKKPKFKYGDVVRVIAPFDSAWMFAGKRIPPRGFNWIGQRAVVVDVSGTTYGIYLASEGPKSYCAWWEERCLEPYNKPSRSRRSSSPHPSA